MKWFGLLGAALLGYVAGQITTETITSTVTITGTTTTTETSYSYTATITNTITDTLTYTSGTVSASTSTSTSTETSTTFTTTVTTTSQATSSSTSTSTITSTSTSSSTEFTTVSTTTTATVDPSVCVNGEWTAWTDCPISCGSGGVITRDKPATNNPWRSDLRCGTDFENAPCNPNNFEASCCSNLGYCGPSTDATYCTCVGCTNYTVFSVLRTDNRCGTGYLAPNGQPAQCDPNGPFPCCSNLGYCGNTPDHCTCTGCVDYRVTVGGICPVTTQSLFCNAESCPIVWRTDGFCGDSNPITNPVTGASVPSTCNPYSLTPCCNSTGQCSEYCFPGSSNYQFPDQKSWRSDGRCGPGFLAPNSDTDWATCNPAGPNFCCSNSGYCGSTADHCDCTGCQSFSLDDYRCGAGNPITVYNSTRPGQCNPASLDRYCCSEQGWCGATPDHCDCPTCINYQTASSG